MDEATLSPDEIRHADKARRAQERDAEVVHVWTHPQMRRRRVRLVQNLLSAVFDRNALEMASRATRAQESVEALEEVIRCDKVSNAQLGAALRDFVVEERLQQEANRKAHEAEELA